MLPDSTLLEILQQQSRLTCCQLNCILHNVMQHANILREGTCLASEVLCAKWVAEGGMVCVMLSW
jgi:hypothetical protein